MMTNQPPPQHLEQQQRRPRRRGLSRLSSISSSAILQRSVTCVLLFLLYNGHCSSAFLIGRQRTARMTTKPTKSTTALGPIARNGLVYTDVTIGQGRRILPGDIVQVYYTGSFPAKTSSGGGVGGLPPQLSSFFGGGKNAGAGVTVFDSIQESDGAPFSFPVGKGQVIEGWDLGILGKADLDIPPMYVGGQRKLTIPAGLAYGSSGNGPIPANQALDFDVRVVQALPAPSAISLSYRLGGYAIALTVPLVLFSIAWFILHNL